MMTLPSFGGSSAPPAVRRPAFAVQFGGGGVLGGLGAAGLATGGTDPWQAAVVAIVVSAGLAPAVDAAEITLSAEGGAPAVAVGDTGSVGLGYDGAPATVFTGQIEAVRHGIQGLTRIIASDGGAALSRLRVNQSYEQQAGGDIVMDLAGRASVDTDTIQSGSSFPFYVIDDRRHAYSHIGALARKCGLVAYVTPEGKLCFASPGSGPPAATFTYGEDLLALDLAEMVPGVGEVTATGEGAAGSQGQNAWGWLLKDPSPVRSTAGSGAPARAISDPSLRTAAAAQQAATGAAEAGQRLGLSGTLLAAGAPDVRVGGQVEVQGAPQAGLNGVYFVRGVEHRYAKGRGFTTRLLIGRTAGGAASSRGLL